jgi:hypothetical protein
VLAHYGVKGMRWGKRKAHPASDASPASSDSATISGHKNKISAGGTKTLSTRELQDLVNRMNLEQQYSKLQKGTPAYKEGLQTVKDIMSVVKTVQEIHGVINSPLVKDIRKTIQKSRGG